MGFEIYLNLTHLFFYYIYQDIISIFLPIENKIHLNDPLFNL